MGGVSINSIDKKKSLLLLLYSVILTSYTLLVPYSDELLKTNDNNISGFVRISPNDSIEIPLETNIWIWHNNIDLFFLWESKIDENFEKGIFAKEDKWIISDFLRLQIITQIEDYYSYFFYMFPLGNVYDGIRESDMTIRLDWDSNYSYESLLENNLWVCTIKIPFKDLRFSRKAPYEWKLILSRYLQESDDAYSIPYGTIEMGKDYFRKAFDITINETIKENKNYRIIPYFINKYDLIDGSEFFDPGNIGMDFSYNPTSSTKMKLSINPDFSDTPMDVVEDNFNVRYVPSYQENRFFFSEDLDVFGVGNQLFYSRHIMQPQYAIKLSGNSKKYSYGFLSAMDKKITESEELLNNDDFFNVLAIKPKWEFFYIKMTLLNRMNKSYHNEVFVLNPVWEFSANHSVWSEVNLSYLDDDDGNKKGYLFLTGYNGKKGNFNWSSKINNCSKNYTADMGLVYRTDFTAIDANLNYNRDFNSRLLKSFGSNIWFHKAFETLNNLLEQNGAFGFWNTFEQKFNIGVNINIGQENHDNEIHNWDSIYFNFSSWKYPLLNFNINYGINHSLVYFLNDVFKQNYFNAGFSGDIGTKLSYNISAQQIRYFDFPINCGMDEKYWICNTDLTINFSNSLSLTNGLRFNDYESSDSAKFLGFFSNFQFEFKKNCNLYLGYKTAQDEIEQKYITDYKKAFMKVSYTF